jgi:replicative DNA helicase
MQSSKTDPAPHTNPVAERAVLNACIENGPMAIAAAQGRLGLGEAFFYQPYRAFWLMLLDLHKSEFDAFQKEDGSIRHMLNESAAFERLVSTPISILEKCTPGRTFPSGTLYDAYLSDYLEVTNAFAPLTGLERDIDLVLDLYRKRTAMRVIHTAAASAQDRTRDPVDIWQQACAEMDAVGKRRTDRLSFHELVQLANSADEMQVVVNAARPVFGVPGLDEMLPMDQGRHFAIAARPGHGKTTLGIQAAGASATAECSVCYISLELCAEDLGRKLRDLELTAAAKERITAIAGRGMTAADLDHAMRQAVTAGAQLVVVDYLQLVSWNPKKPRQTEYDRVSEASLAATRVAVEERVCVLSLAQLSRDFTKQSKPRPPVLADLKGSGQIEQDVSGAVFLHPVGDDTADVCDYQLIVAKNRWGPKGVVSSTFNKPAGRFAQTMTPEEETAALAAKLRSRAQGDFEDGVEEDFFG